MDKGSRKTIYVTVTKPEREAIINEPLELSSDVQIFTKVFYMSLVSATLAHICAWSCKSQNLQFQSSVTCENTETRFPLLNVGEIVFSIQANHDIKHLTDMKSTHNSQGGPHVTARLYFEYDLLL